MPVLSIQKQHLPCDFKNTIIGPKSNDQVIIRSNLSSIEDIKNWVSAFSLLTNTKWNAEISNPNGEAMLVGKENTS